MSVRLRNNKWVIDFYTDGRKGRRIQLSLPANIGSRAEALAYEKEYKKFQKEAPLSPPANSTITNMTPMFFEYCEMHKAAKDQ